MQAFARRCADEIIQKTHQAVFVVKIVQITISTLDPTAAADRIPYGTGLVASNLAKPSPKTTFVRFLHATRPYRQLRRAYEPGRPIVKQHRGNAAVGKRLALPDSRRSM